MFNSSLVSIYFLQNQFLVAELDPKKKRVSRFAIEVLPEGAVVDNKVVNPPELAKVIKDTFTKHKFTEKSIGIIIPEFSTFSKSFLLPKLSAQELHEAVVWQAQEFLPDLIDKMVVDWKIVNKSDSGYEVLIVAIQKDLLKGYVQACELAGLFPRGVQTPSLCLTNLITGSNPSIIVYSGFNETLVVVSVGGNIVGTSVILDSTENDIISTVSKMVSHYKNLTIKNLYVCGNDITDNIITQLKDTLKLEVEGLTPKILDLDVPSIQQLIVPISMLTKPLNEPSDPETINLLPMVLIERYKVKKAKMQIWSLMLTATIFIWFCLIIVLGSYLVINQQIASLKLKNIENSNELSQIQTYEEQSKKINDISAKVLKIKKAFISPQAVLNHISASTPEGVSVQKYKMDLEKGFVEISGLSKDRDSLLSFKESLEKNPGVTSLNIPISNFEKISNLEFYISFNYSPASNK